MEAPLQLIAAILPYAAHMPGKKWPSSLLIGTRNNLSFLQPWHAGHKKPAQACAAPYGLCQTGNGDFGVRTWP
jgi:hypothetical protein